MSGRIDVHQHLIPQFYRQALDEFGLTAGGLSAPAWSEDLALRAMDKHRVETGILSVSTPGVYFGDAVQAVILARRVNEYAARLCERHAGRFSFFASLPAPDMDASLEEVAFALDELHADGVILLANIAGQYLGAPVFEPLLAELNRRRSVVFIHPDRLPGQTATGIPPYVADFLLDTTRTAVSLVRSGAIRKFPGIRFVLSHGGGFIPFASHRLAMTLTFDSDRTVEDFLADFRSFHVDTAQASSPMSMPAVLGFFGADHVLFGTDWPHASDPGVAYFVEMYEQLQLTDADRAAIDHGNSRRLFLPANSTGQLKA